jgi:ABC-2 type transport system ATP-binding protein
LKKLLVDYNAQTGATILISSHNLQNTIDISTHVTLLEHGKVIIDMPKSEEIDKTLIDYFQI